MEWHERNPEHDIVRELHLRTSEFHNKTGHAPEVLYIGHETKRDLFMHARCFAYAAVNEGEQPQQRFAGMRVITVTEPHYLGMGV